jgi:hypothetical protein
MNNLTRHETPDAARDQLRKLVEGRQFRNRGPERTPDGGNSYGASDG